VYVVAEVETEATPSKVWL